MVILTIFCFVGTCYFLIPRNIRNGREYDIFLDKEGKCHTHHRPLERPFLCGGPWPPGRDIYGGIIHFKLRLGGMFRRRFGEIEGIYVGFDEYWKLRVNHDGSLTIYSREIQIDGNPKVLLEFVKMHPKPLKYRQCLNVQTA